MTRMRLASALLIALPVLAPLAPVQAQTLAARPSRAMTIAVGEATKDFTQKQVAVLQLAAHAAATAQLCDGVSLDDVAVEKSVGDMMTEASQGVSEQERIRLHDLALVTFGALSGLALGEATRNEAAYCKTARADASDPEKFAFLRLDPPKKP